MRGRWLATEYSGLRNAAWAVRNSRVGAGFNPLALRLALAEAEGLIAKGESLGDVLKAFAELLARPLRACQPKLLGRNTGTEPWGLLWLCSAGVVAQCVLLLNASRSCTRSTSLSLGCP